MARSIAAALIVKNEGEFLAECLSGLRGLADEIVVVDTGSTDDTVEVARRFGARVTYFLWCDDFAAARNEAIWLCTSDWIFVIDADERLNPSDLPHLRELAQGPEDLCYRFTTRNYTNNRAVSEFAAVQPDDPLNRGFEGWYPSAKIRLFPNHKGIRFEGKVHELVNASVEEAGLRIADSPIPIHHYPLARDAERIRQKQAQYIRLGLEKMQSNPEDARAAAELGAQYAEVGNYAQAAAAFREALKRDPSNPVVLKDLGCSLHMLGRSEEAQNALKLAIELDPNLADAWRGLGVIAIGFTQWQSAVDSMTQAVKLDPAHADGHRYFSIALEGVGRVDEAAKHSRIAFQAMADSVEAMQLYIHQMLRLERRREARDFLRALIKEGHDSAMLHNAVGELYYYDNLIEEAKSHFRRAGRKGLASAYNNLGVVLFREQRYAEAREAFDACLVIDPTHRGAHNGLRAITRYLGDDTPPPIDIE